MVKSTRRRCGGGLKRQEKEGKKKTLTKVKGVREKRGNNQTFNVRHKLI